MSRIIAQNALTKEILTWELPLEGVQIKWQLSGPSLISGSLSSPTADLASLGISSWGTLLHYEDDNGDITSGIVMPYSVDGFVRAVEAEGLTTFPHGIPWQGEYQGIKVDPAAVFRMIWQEIQVLPASNLGVTVVGDFTDQTIGEEPRLVEFEAEVPQDGEFIDEDYVPVTEDVSFEAGPYKLNWWETTDCGSELDSLASTTPFDYREKSYWNAGKTEIIHEVVLGYPRLGRKRDDLRFTQYDNIKSFIPIAENRDVYASEVIVCGAGEGRDMIRANAMLERAPRLRRVVTISDSTIQSNARAQAIAEDELSRRQAFVAIEKIVIDAYHDNAPLGSFQVGDDIFIQADLPWMGRVELWHRVIAISYTLGSEEAELTLLRSDLMRYGAGSQTGVTT